MKKHLKTLFVVCLLVPCMLFLAACGNTVTETRYKLSSAEISVGITTISLDFTNADDLAEMLEEYEMEEYAETIIDALTSFNLLVTDTEIQIRLDISKLINVVLAGIETINPGDSEMDSIVDMLEDTQIPAMELAYIFKYKKSGTSLVFVDSEGGNIELPDGISFAKTNSAVTITLEAEFFADIMGELGMDIDIDNVVITFAKI